MFKIVKNQFRKHPELEIKLPTRGTAHSAGYDFCTPVKLEIQPQSTSELIFTDVCVELENNQFLMILPRSSVGIKKGLMLANTAGIIDSDYYDNESNGGNIGFKLYNYSDKVVVIEAGEKIIQGIITYFNNFDDEVKNSKRIGGFGSTDKE